jgi:hypothetical protein
MLYAQPLPRPLPHLNGAGNQTCSIVSTLIYYDLFAFPPTSSELQRFGHQSGSDGHFDERDLTTESAWWSSRDGYWFLKGREHLIEQRAQMSQASIGKLNKARRLARALQLIPGIRFIGVTGSLSMASSLPQDDIDLLIIAASRRLWMTRALVLAVLWIVGVKRPDDEASEHPDQVCANIFLQEDDLKIGDHNLFIAHEICQMMPLLGPQVYERFVQANAWVRDYLPQWRPPAAVWEDRSSLRFVQGMGELLLGGAIRQHLEDWAMRHQLARIKNKHARGHNVRIKVSATQLRFHPRDLSNYVVTAFEARWSDIQSNGHSIRRTGNNTEEVSQVTHA